MAALVAYISSIAAGVLLVLLPLSAPFVHSLSNEDSDDPGKIYPEVVEIEIGGSVNITCRMNPLVFKGYNASHMYFINEYTKERVPDADIMILNSTTIVFLLRNAREQKSKFICKCDTFAIATDTSVYVGTPPRSVSDFNCRGYDFEYMICNFTQPENQLLTQYNLTLYLESYYKYSPICNFEGQPLVVCNITGDHGSVNADYHFVLYSKNALGSKTETFNISKLNVMVPARPGDNLNMTNVSDSSIELQWYMHKWDDVKPRELQWEVLLTPPGSPDKNLSTQVRFKRNRTTSLMQLKLSSLPHAFYMYELRLRAKVSTAADTEDMWSAPLVYQFRTAARLPDRPPRTDYGSFYVNSSETDVRLYWEELEAQEYNGYNFTYVIRASETWPNGTSKRQLQPKIKEPNSAVYPWRNDRYYIYDIRSRNHVGESLGASRIQLFPQKSRKQRLPHSIHNVYHATNRTYTLTWEAPYDTAELQDYTVYWCYSKRALQTECKGSIHFQHVKSDTRRFITQPQKAEQEPLNLAISANYFNYNTGMHWTSCTMDVNSDLEPMAPDVEAISPTAIKVQWSSESVCPSILEGYNLTFCEVTNENGNASISPCQNEPIKIERNAKKYIIKDLKPYSLYRIEMFMYSRGKVGKVSEPLVKRTHEAAPEPPRQLKVVDVRNTSAILSWMPPSQANGLIRHYIIKVNERDFPVNASLLDPINITFVLENLIPYTFYSVNVRAKTVERSSPSNNIHFTTRIGFPSKVTNVTWQSENMLKWSRPVYASGRTDFYEVIMTELHKESVMRRRISIVNGTSCELRAPTCPDHDYKTVVEVRAVNVANLATEVADNDWTENDPYFYNYDGSNDLVCADNGLSPINTAELARFRNISMYRLYKSAWERGSTFACAPREMSKITLIAPLVVIFVLVLGVLTLICGKKCSTMSNIKCTLPAGLDAYITKDNAVGGGYGLSGGVGGSGYANDFMSPTAAIERSSERIISGPRLFKEINNEEHHLLGTMCNDSGYMGDVQTLGRSISAVDGAIDTVTQTTKDDMYRRRKQRHSESSVDSLVDSTDTTEGEMEERQTTTTTPLQALQLKRIIEEESAYVQASTQGGLCDSVNIDTATCDNGYIKPTNMTAWSRKKPPPQALQKVTSPALSSGYVALDNMISAAEKHNTSDTQNRAAISAMPTSGYVQPSAFQKLLFPAEHDSNTQGPTNTNISGYTSLDTLGKIGIDMGMNTQTPHIITQNTTGRQALPGISGYVTQGELNAFGQQQYFN